jgi:hypothetical protein
MIHPQFDVIVYRCYLDDLKITDEKAWITVNNMEILNSEYQLSTTNLGEDDK